MRVSCGVLLVAALIACGGGGGDGYNAPPTAPPPSGDNPDPTPNGSASVSMRSLDDGYGTESHSFSPGEVTIAEGGTVTWNNDTGLLHNVTFSGTGAPTNITSFSTGSQQRTFESAGTFNYQCTNHIGMTGRVVVE